jgi:hypothetical protein
MALLLDKLLLDKSDLSVVRDISANITDDKVNIFIREAQTINVKPFLGAQLYLLLLNDYTVATKSFATQKYTDLWFGSNYTNTNGVVVRQNGLLSAAPYFVYGRMVLQQNTNVGRYGVGSLNQENTTTSGPSTVRTNTTQANAVALSYQKDVETFLRDNLTIYPEFNTKTTTGQKIAAPFFKV